MYQHTESSNHARIGVQTTMAVFEWPQTEWIYESVVTASATPYIRVRHVFTRISQSAVSRSPATKVVSAKSVSNFLW
jgi:hypothetical protein